MSDQRLAQEISAEKVRALRAIAQAHKQKMEAKARDKLKALHWLHCPKCGMDMESVIVGGVEVERCFACGGTFLDAGDLERLANEARRPARDDDPNAITQIYRTLRAP